MARRVGHRRRRTRARGRGARSGRTPLGRLTLPQARANKLAIDWTRYTPPVPNAYKVSPWWIPALMFTFLGLGALIIVLNYINFPFGEPSNWRLLAGLGSILAGILVATRYQ